MAPTEKLWPTTPQPWPCAARFRLPSMFSPLFGDIVRRDCAIRKRSGVWSVVNIDRASEGVHFIDQIGGPRPMFGMCTRPNGYGDLALSGHNSPRWDGPNFEDRRSTVRLIRSQQAPGVSQITVAASTLRYPIVHQNAPEFRPYCTRTQRYTEPPPAARSPKIHNVCLAYAVRPLPVAAAAGWGAGSRQPGQSVGHGGLSCPSCPNPRALLLCRRT